MSRIQSNEVVLDGWPSGVNNVANLKELQRLTAGRSKVPALREAQNVDIDAAGGVARRDGFERLSTDICHSIYAPEDWPFAVFVKNGLLSLLDNSGTSEVITSLGYIDASKPISYCLQNDYIYGTNGLVTFRLGRDGVVSSWGVPTPAGHPLVSTPSSVGSLDPGTYQITLTNLSASGEESGALPPVAVTLAAGFSAITLSNIPQSPAAAKIRVYMTAVNGTELRHAVTIDAGVLTTTILGDQSLGRGLETLHYDRVPPARWLCAYRGRIYFASGNLLCYTDPLRYGLYKVHSNYFGFPHSITGVAAVDNGLYVATEKNVYFLGGNDPKDMSLLPVEFYGAVEGTVQAWRNLSFGLNVPEQELAAVWWSNNGYLVRGGPGGQTVPITKGKLALPKFASGALLRREYDEVQQLVSVLRGPQYGSPLAASDSASVEVVRNGITIE